jgi:hypothetical protein
MHEAKQRSLTELATNAALVLGHASKKFQPGHPSLSAALSAYAHAHILIELALLNDALRPAQQAAEPPAAEASPSDDTTTT